MFVRYAIISGMETADQNRARRKLHFVTWVWVALFAAASFAVNILYRIEQFGFGWPLAYSERQLSDSWVVFFPNRFSVTALVLLYNVVICVTILLLSAVAVERRCRIAQLPRFRLRLSGLLVFIAWIAIGCLFFREVSLFRFDIAIMRALDWLLLIEFVGIGLALLGALDLVAWMLRAINRLTLRVTQDSAPQ